ncbi:hypothetical protein B0H13DRAFT_2318816 [Mycena leptocephala]|nr:hypothetical protein B0H13DRAFT_2318816 [Mycena leptocephala]
MSSSPANHPSAFFCNLPLSSSIDPTCEASLLSLDWVLSPGVPAFQSVASGLLALPSGKSVCSMHMKLRICSDLPYDLVLGRDWLFFCRETLPHASFILSSGVVTPGRLAASSHNPVPSPSVPPPLPTASDDHEHDDRDDAYVHLWWARSLSVPVLILLLNVPHDRTVRNRIYDLFEYYS